MQQPGHGILLVATFLIAGAHTSPPGPGLDRARVTADSLISSTLGTQFSGAVFLVAQGGKVLEERAFGVVRTSTLFDLASLTKVMATTFAVMLLVDRGQVNVDAPVSRYLPDFRGPQKDSITVRHLLTHSAGLEQWQPLYYHAANSRETYDLIRSMPLKWGVGEARHYSDLGFMLLGYLVERVSGRRLDQFLAEELYRPLNLNSTTFNPKQHGFTDFAATEQGNGYERHMVYDSTFGYLYRGDPTGWDGWRHYMLSGEADDGNSWYANGGVAGHAGLFSTAPDLRVLLDLLGNHGSYAGRRYLRPETVDLFLTRDRFQNYLGWQLPAELPEGSFAHNGFTGTYVLGVPKYQLFLILLTNRQSMGTNDRGYFPDLGPLQQAVTHALVAGAQSDAQRAPHQKGAAGSGRRLHHLLRG